MKIIHSHSRLVLVGIISLLLPTGCVLGLSTTVQTPSTATATTSALNPKPQTRTEKTLLTAPPSPLHDFDYHTQDRLPWLPDGYSTWYWQGRHKINYIELGDSGKPALLLIHGFGASVYHFRYNVPVLARDYHVFAMDLLGFGSSDKPLVDLDTDDDRHPRAFGYSAELWRDQAADFITHVIGKPTTVAGNSLGGFTALYACTVNRIRPLIRGCILLNGAGRFRDPTATEESSSNVVLKDPDSITERFKATLRRFIIAASFHYTKQPARIEQVLRQVYPVHPNVVDDELIQSIRYPSRDPSAAEIFFRVVTKNGGGPVPVYVDDLLQRLPLLQQKEEDATTSMPLLLCWGEEDPWIRSTVADRIQTLYPTARRVSIRAGHCPHDEAADDVNAAIHRFLQSIHSPF